MDKAHKDEYYQLAARFQDAIMSLETEIPEITLNKQVVRLTLNQVRTLHLVSRNPGLRQKDLARILGVTPPAVTNLIRRLIDLDLVEATLNGDDKRAHSLWLTQKGKAAFLEVREAQIEIAAQFLQPIPLKTQQSIVQSLEHALEAKKDFG
jgi:DNA-binding MarR family transcriptional regulator